MARHGGWLLSVPRIATSLCALWLLLCGLASCSSNRGGLGMEGPLVRLHLSSVDPAGTQVTLNVVAKDPSGQDKQNSYMFSEGPLDLLGISFPLGTRGSTTYQVTLYGDASCVVATGTATFSIDSDGVFDVTVNMTPTPLCGNGATLTVQISRINNGSGTVTSAPAGISCTSAASDCSVTLMKGAQITLSAQAAAGSKFGGWTGGGCDSNGTGACMLTLNQNISVQAVFTTCTGWCQEQLPFPISTNLNAIAGTGGSNIYVVGDSGTLLKYDGQTWQRLTLPATASSVNLRAIAMRASPSMLIIAGDNGTILRFDGTNWETIANAVILGAVRGIGIGGHATEPDTHFVGDGTFGAILPFGDDLVDTPGKDIGGAGTIYSISQNPNTTGDESFIGGAMSGGKGYAAKWDGNNTAMQQMASGPSIAGDIYAMLCRGDYYYAAGAGGAIFRRTSANGQDNIWATVNSPATGSLRAMWGPLNTFIVSVGDGGNIVQYDGFTWTKVGMVPVTSKLNGVWGLNPSNIYAVGDGGVVLHYLPN